MQFIKNLLKGRTGRKGYLLPALFFVIIPYVLSILAVVGYSVFLPGIVSGLAFFVRFLVYSYPFLLLILIPLSIRRLHDIGKSGWLSLPVAIPLVNFFTVLILSLIPGEKQKNKYGAVPQMKRKKTFIVFSILIPIFFFAMFVHHFANYEGIDYYLFSKEE